MVEIDEFAVPDAIFSQVTELLWLSELTIRD